MKHYTETLKSMGAPSDLLRWLEKNNFPSLQEAWDVCEEGDWMLWLIYKTQDIYIKTTIFIAFATPLIKNNPKLDTTLDMLSQCVKNKMPEDELMIKIKTEGLKELNKALVPWIHETITKDSNNDIRKTKGWAIMQRQHADICRNILPICPEINLNKEIK